MNIRNIRGLGYLLIVYIVWGSTYLAIRIAVRDGSGFPALAMAGSRSLVGGLILLAWTGLSRRPLRPTRRDLMLLAVSGVLLWMGGNGMVSWAEKHAESGYTALLVGAMPIWTTILDSFIDRRRPTLRLTAALLIGISGVAVLNIPVLRHGARADIVAAGALVLAVFSWGIGSIIQKRNPVALGGVPSSGYQLVSGGIALVIVAMLSGEPRPTPIPHAWAAWGYLVIFGSVLGFTSFVKALRSLPTHVVMTYAYVNPVIAVILGAMILHEPITIWTLAGSALVILGVAGVFHELRRARAQRRAAAAAA